MNAEKHYVVVPTVQRLRSWAHDNLTEWHERGHGVIVTRTGVYRAVIALHQLRGVSLTPETIHWADGWDEGLSAGAALELQAYAATCIRMGESR